MMKMLNSFLFAAVMSVFALSVQAAGEAAAAPAGKVVVIDLQRAVLSTAAAREQLKAMESEKEFAENRKKAESIQKEMDKKSAEAQKDGATWSNEQQMSYRRDMEMMQKEMQLLVQKLQSEKQAVFNRISKDMESKLKKVLEQLIKEENISLLLDKGAAHFAHPAFDVTEKVTQRLNEAK